MAIELTVSPDLATVVRIGGLAGEVSRVLEHDPDLDESLGRAEEAAPSGDRLDVGPSRYAQFAGGIETWRWVA